MEKTSRRGFLGKLAAIIAVGVAAPATLLESPPLPLRWLVPTPHYKFDPAMSHFVELDNITVFAPKNNFVIRDLRDPR